MGFEPALGIVIAITGAVGTAGGIGALLWAVGKVKGLELTVNLLKNGNEALRAELDDAGRRHADELGRLEAERQLDLRTAAERIARLEGHNAALLDGLADKLADAIGARLEVFIHQLRQPPTPGGPA